MSNANQSGGAPVIVRLRRDFRLTDHPALRHAAQNGRAVVPLFIRDDTANAMGAAPKWRLGRAIRCFAATLRKMNSALILRSGNAETVLADVVRETGAREVVWTREHLPAEDARDAQIQKAMKTIGVRAEGFDGRILLRRPDDIRTQAGGECRVFAPYWRALCVANIPAPLPKVSGLTAPKVWPRSEEIEEWKTGAAMMRGAEVVSKYSQTGEARGLARLEDFLSRRVGDYGGRRDYLAEDSVSRLSEHLAWGEVSPRTVWARAKGRAGADAFLRQLAWREFARQLLFHFPAMAERCWRREWESFPWRGDNEDAERWRRGATGVPLADAAMREMIATGTMHNRGRMVAASFLCKHLRTDWRAGLAWFAERLTDWDPANNALGWQWTAGCGPDAAPYFRVFNPAVQAGRFDADGEYCRRYVAELSGGGCPPEPALDFFRAIPPGWGMSPDDAYPPPIVDLAEGRERALSALAEWRKSRENG